MKQLFSRSLAHFGQRRPRLTWLAVLPLAITLLWAFTPMVSPAFAATNSHIRSNLVATKPTSSIGLAQMGHVSVASTILTSSRNSAGDPCGTITFQENYLVFGNIVAWLKMVTSWCYNYVIVTSHSTILYWGVTSFGNATGWLWRYPPNYSFNCYVASGSTRNCSGNHEWTQQLFDNAFTHAGIALTVNEEENYHGQAWGQGSSITCPGGC